MTDYTDLINELVCYAENDQDFIEPHDSINTKAAEAIKTLVAERDHWKNNHATEVRRARILKERPDLPIERVQAYEKWRKDQDERNELLAAMSEARNALQMANDTPNGPINDTIWMMHGPETLFDFMDSAISSIKDKQ